MAALEQIDNSVFERTVVDLQAFGRANGIEHTVQVGRLLLERFFSGNFDRWHDRRRNKDASIRRLAARPGCPYGRSALASAITVYEIWSGIGCDRTSGHLRSSHVAAVAGLPGELQRELLDKAERERWTVRKLRAACTSRRHARGERRGRAPANVVSLLAVRLRLVEGALDDVCAQLESGAISLEVVESVTVRAEQHLRAVRGALRLGPATRSTRPGRSSPRSARTE